MKIKITFTFLLVIALAFVGINVLSSVKIFADEEVDESSEQVEEEVVDTSALEDRIKELEEKIGELKSRGNTLKNEIENLDNQIEVTGYKIASATAQIEDKTREINFLKNDIEFLENRLDRIKDSIDTQEVVLDKRIREKYKNSRMSNFNFLVTNDGFSEVINLIKYSEVAEERDSSLIREMRTTEKSYETQQGILETKKSQVEDVRQEIEAEKNNLENLNIELGGLKQEKNNLLSVTQNDEKKFQDLLADAKRELEQITAAAGLVIRNGEGVDVEKGEVIGTMGNSGYSTGAHLHFGVYRYSPEDFFSHSSWGWYYSSYVNPIDKLKKKDVNWATGCYLDPSGKSSSGNGSWEWPMSSPRITQNYGNNTCYNWMYGGKAHPALDIVGMGDISVRSVADGEAYFCRNCLGDGGNGVFVFHDDNYMTLYWHLK